MRRRLFQLTRAVGRHRGQPDEGAEADLRFSMTWPISMAGARWELVWFALGLGSQAIVCVPIAWQPDAVAG